MHLRPWLVLALALAACDDDKGDDDKGDGDKGGDDKGDGGGGPTVGYCVESCLVYCADPCAGQPCTCVEYPKGALGTGVEDTCQGDGVLYVDGHCPTDELFGTCESVGGQEGNAYVYYEPGFAEEYGGGGDDAKENVSRRARRPARAPGWAGSARVRAPMPVMARPGRPGV